MNSISTSSELTAFFSNNVLSKIASMNLGYTGTQKASWMSNSPEIQALLIGTLLLLGILGAVLLLVIRHWAGAEQRELFELNTKLKSELDALQEKLSSSAKRLKDIEKSLRFDHTIASPIMVHSLSTAQRIKEELARRIHKANSLLTSSNFEKLKQAEELIHSPLTFSENSLSVTTDSMQLKDMDILDADVNLSKLIDQLEESFQKQAA